MLINISAGTSITFHTIHAVLHYIHTYQSCSVTSHETGDKYMQFALHETKLVVAVCLRVLN
jgi:hypothetical protein